MVILALEDFGSKAFSVQYFLAVVLDEAHYLSGYLVLGLSLTCPRLRPSACIAKFETSVNPYFTGSVLKERQSKPKQVVGVIKLEDRIFQGFAVVFLSSSGAQFFWSYFWVFLKIRW